MSIPVESLPDDYPAITEFPTTTQYPSVLLDAEFLIRGWLQGQFPAAYVCTETDEDLAARPWTLKVGAGGGPVNFTLWTPRVTLDTFAQTRGEARGKALLADHAMRWLLRGIRLGGVATVSRVGVLSGPMHVPDANSRLRHWSAMYTPTFSPLA